MDRAVQQPRKKRRFDRVSGLVRARWSSPHHHHGESEMNKSKRICVVATAAVAALCAVGLAHAQQANMTFFVTSAGSGKGADLGGTRRRRPYRQSARAGSRRRRQDLARLPAARKGRCGVNARDRIGKGPWTNAKGVVVAKDVAELHGDEQPHQADRAHREGRRRQRPRRHAEHARHSHGLATRRHEAFPTRRT